MREYGQVQVGFWVHEDIRELSNEGKLFAVYLLTCQHSNSLGCYRLPDGYVIEDLGWKKETVSKGFQELKRNRFCFRDEKSGWILLPNFLKWNVIQNPNVAKGIEKLFESVPEIFEHYETLLDSLLKFGTRLSEPFRNHLETVSKRFRNKEPEPEPEPIDSVGLTPEPLPNLEQEAENQFALFWQEYPPRGKPPTRENRKGAFKVWLKYARGKNPPLLKEVLGVLEEYKRKDQWKDPRYIPLATTWLNTEPWKENGRPLLAAMQPVERQPDVLDGNRLYTDDGFGNRVCVTLGETPDEVAKPSNPFEDEED